MIPGTTFAGRFVVENVAGRGGMGEVFRARDLADGALVAVKVMRGHASLSDRFLREATILEKLAHPGIVRHLAHGTSEDGTPWVAMEWLEGEDLERRLARRGLLLEESVALAAEVADALGHAHARGIVHRDVKPSNILLIDDDPARPKLLDFGVAHVAAATRALTEVGAVVGTVGYMAPEQASGTEVDARTDVFSLGCVLYECLTGQPAYFGQNPLACLAKLLVGEPPRPRALRKSVPAELDELCFRMLSRDPGERPPDGAEVAALLRATSSSPRPTIPAPLESRPVAITLAEQRIHSVVLAEIADAAAVDAPTVTPEQLYAGFAPLEEAARRFGGSFVRLGPSVVLLALEGRESASDQAEQAVQAASDLKAALPEARVAIATGRAESTARGPVGPLIDRAFSLLREGDEGTFIPIDDATRGLLGARFDVETAERGHRLLRQRPSADAGRRLLGRPVPCVGRDRELASLEATLAETIDEGVARAVLVTAPPGTGKTRLFEELLARARAESPSLRVLVVRAEPVRASSPLSLARALVRDALGVSMRDPQAARDAFLASAGGLALDAARASGLFDLAGLVREGDAALREREARRDPSAQRDEVRRAFEAWLSAECARAPVLLVIEDLQWSDPTSAELVASAFRKASGHALFLLALARPEVHDVLPQFARDVSAEEVRLGGLVRRAAERLVRAALGDRVDDRVVARIVELSDGNAFYLEELVRWVAEGRGTEPGSARQLPESVVAMAQVRLLRLDEEARRALRVGSVLDGAFGPEDLAPMLGLGDGGPLGGLLERLARDEVLTEIDGGRFTFRHALLRAAAYATLTETDRLRAHALAGALLVARGEPDPLVVARHFEIAGDGPRAITWLVRAAREALDVGSVDDVQSLVARAVAAGAEGEELGLCCSLEAFAHGRRGEWTLAVPAATRALELLPRGSSAWFRTAGALVFAESNAGKLEATVGILSAVLGLSEVPEPSPAYGRTVGVLVSALVFAGQVDIAAQLLAGLERAASTVARGSLPLFDVYAATARSVFALSGKNDLEAALVESARAFAGLDHVADSMATILACTARGRALIDVGRYDEAEAVVERARAEAARTGSTYMGEWAETIGASGRVLAGDTRDLRARLAPIVSGPSPVLSALSRLSLALIALDEGSLDEASLEVDLAARAFAPPFVQSIACAHRARIALARGDAARALAEASEGIGLRAHAGGVLVDLSWLRYAKARALLDLGREDEADAALRDALAHLDATMRALDPEDRARFTRVPPNALTLALAVDRQIAAASTVTP